MRNSSSAFKITCIACAVVALAGLGCWIMQLLNGLSVTGMSDGTSWGLYITNFMFFVGLSAGGLIVASSASIFHIEKYKQVALPAVILSTVCICCAAIFIMVDLGGIAKIWRLLTGPNFTSPLIWDVLVITTYLVVNVLYLYFMCSKNKSSRSLSILSRFALPVAILVHSVTAWIFGLQNSMEGWYSAIMAPLFVVSAMDSGIALLLLCLMGMKKSGRFSFDDKLIPSLAGLLATIVAIDGFLVACEVLTLAYPSAGGMNVLSVMLTGATAPFFWVETIVGVAIPFLILVFQKNREKRSLVALASACVIIGVFCKRAWLLISSFAAWSIPTTTGLIGGAGEWEAAWGYFPTVIEFSIALGVIALGILAFLLVSSKLIPKD